ncbi:MAG: lipoyl(octanoyl) transferase LipB [Polyangiaceae bacterium]|nr:lipoyl(octanoyl) transferase LipB [Polyangiaceae bacterium]
MPHQLTGVWLGRRPYGPVLELQRALHAARVSGRGHDVALLVEHDPVITMGRSARAEHLLAPEAALRAAGFTVAAAERGGDVTVHGPGQLVVYPIVALDPGRRDVRRYVNRLAETMRRTIGDHGVAAEIVEGLVGLWVDRESPREWRGTESTATMAKIGAIGVRISRWVTMHGFALNLSIDLGLFRHVIPCGIREHPVTSLAELTGRPLAVADVAPRTLTHLAAELGLDRAEFCDGTRWPLEPGAPPAPLLVT